MTVSPTEWYELYGPEAAAEGWSLFECNDASHAPWELERIDFPEDGEAQLDSDLAAFELVVSKAREGSQMHVDTLGFLIEYSNEEYEWIMGSVV